MADIAKINGLNLKDAAARADIATAKTDIAGLKESVIKEINSMYIRITDYPTGVYKLTYNGTKYIYYNGATSTSTVDVKGSSGAVILTVNRYSTSRWSWSYINTDVNGVMYLGYGQTNTSSGTRNVMTLPSDVTGTLATTALATTSISGLMSSADKTKLNKVYTEKVFKEVHFSTSGGDSGTTKYFDMFAEFDNTTKTVRITGTMKVTYANSSDLYKLISVSLINSKLGSPGLSTSTFKYGYWWGNKKESSTLDMEGYGTGITIEQTSYLGFGRYHTSSFSYGNWAADTFKDNMVNGMVHFEVVFTYTGTAS